MSALLEVQALETAYGPSQVLFGVAFSIHQGEVATLLGRNGMGKSTTIKSIMGLVDGHGSVKWHDKEMLGTKPYDIARRGIGQPSPGPRLAGVSL